MRRTRHYVTQIDPPIGPYYLMVLWDEPRWPRWRHKIWMRIMRTFGLGSEEH